MDDPGERAERIAELLCADSSPLRRRGAEVIVAHAFDRRLGDVVDVDDVVELLWLALTEDDVARAVERYIEPGWRRQLARAAASGERVGEAIPTEVRPQIDALLAELRAPPAAWADGMIDRTLLRDLVAPVLQQTLLAFARKLPLMGTSDMGGIAGRIKKQVERRAEKLADAGRKAMGGLGAEIDARMQKTARDFSREALEQLRAALRERLKSDEGREIVRQLRAHAFEHAMGAPVAELMADADTLGRARIAELLPAIVAHNARRPEVREAVAEELRAALEIVTGRTIGELLAEAGLLARATELATEAADREIRALLGRLDAVSWVAEVLAASQG